MYKFVPAPHLSFARADGRSSACPHASSTRSGRVAVNARAYGELARVSALGDPPANASERTSFVVLPPSGDKIVVEREGGLRPSLEVRLPSGALAFGRVRLSTGAHVLAGDTSVYVDGAQLSWAGALEPLSLFPVFPGGDVLSWGMDANVVRVLIVNPPVPRHSGPLDVDHTIVEVRSVDQDGPGRGRWLFSEEGTGVGAIDGRGYTAIAMPGGRFVVLYPTGDENLWGIVAVEGTVDPGATDLSIVPPFAMVLYGGGDAGRAAKSRGVPASGSRLQARRPDGSLAWALDLPFAPAQPPIDGGDRIYVAGAGLTAVDMSGHIQWSSASSVPIRAQAFADGTLAAVRGSELQIVTAEGSILQAFRASEELTSYPAIGPDGAVWVASATALYVAR